MGRNVVLAVGVARYWGGLIGRLVGGAGLCGCASFEQSGHAGGPSTVAGSRRSGPVALLPVAVLHFVPGDVAAYLAEYRAALGAGSVIALSHGSVDQDEETGGALDPSQRR